MFTAAGYYTDGSTLNKPIEASLVAMGMSSEYAAAKTTAMGVNVIRDLTVRGLLTDVRRILITLFTSRPPSTEHPMSGIQLIADPQDEYGAITWSVNCFASNYRDDGDASSEGWTNVSEATAFQRAMLGAIEEGFEVTATLCTGDYEATPSERSIVENGTKTLTIKEAARN